MKQFVLGVPAAAILALAACQSDNLTSPAADTNAPAAAFSKGRGGASAAGPIFVKCEVRRNRSKISVDGNNLTPLNGTFSARVTSGANSVAAPAAQAIGDEAEFDFDSNPRDIAAGATPIPANFIVGASVTGEILDANGAVVGSSTAACRVR